MICDNFTRKAKVTNVVDGDTIDLEIDLGFYTKVTHRIRLLRIDCPEKFGQTKEQGLKAKEFTTKKLLGKDVFLKTEKTDSFKRWLGEVYYYENDELRNISDDLLNSGNAIIFK